MKIDSTHGYKAVMKISDTVTFEDRSVTIRCGITTCKFTISHPQGMRATWLRLDARTRSKDCWKQGRSTERGNIRITGVRPRRPRLCRYAILQT